MILFVLSWFSVEHFVNCLFLNKVIIIIIKTQNKNQNQKLCIVFTYTSHVMVGGATIDNDFNNKHCDN